MWMINQKSRRSAAFALYVDFRVFSWAQSLLSLLSKMPTFHIFKDGNKLADLVGADVGKLTVCALFSGRQA
jgi:hypothetical protein